MELIRGDTRSLEHGSHVERSNGSFEGIIKIQQGLWGGVHRCGGIWL